ncbi:unnamed protein product [Acanthoscelides obtectus]|uniref:Uncharacterized protein n=1 Tax=Acanthoscelides obtectus TaxID=200917 RepID=A0A9P0MDG4_ACAOB|nr:unnamed protein product [Acanthoscelides obtectus]CAK1659890.1 hypothetical protein AOBTE_LOCUS21733 [Acanthoscelides obtectus]
MANTVHKVLVHGCEIIDAFYTNKDLMRVLLLTSDPFISSKRKVSSKKYKKCNEAVQNYLKKQENDDLGIDLGTITNDTAPSKKSYSD